MWIDGGLGRAYASAAPGDGLRGLMDEARTWSASWPLLRIGWREVCLVPGYLGMAGAGVLQLRSGQTTGIALLAAAVAGLVFLPSRWLPTGIWLGAAGWTAFHALSGQPAFLVLTLIAVVEGALAARPADLSPRPAASHPEVAAAGSPARSLDETQPVQPDKVDAPPVAALTPDPLPAAALAELPQAPATPADGAALIEPLGRSQPVPSEPTEASPVPTPTSAETLTDALAESAASFPPLQIRTIGAIRISSEGEDLTKEFLRKPKLSAVALVILVRYLQAPKQPIFIPALTTEVAWHLGDKGRDATLKLLSDVEGRLLPALGCRISHDPRSDTIRFRADGCRVDFLEVRQLAAELRPLRARVDEQQLARARTLLEEVGPGTFLPNWEGRTSEFLNRDGDIGDIVAALRSQSRRDRAEIAAAIGFALYGTPGQLEESQRYLELAVEMEPGRAEVVSRLEVIYKETGRLDLARSLKERHAELV